MEVQLKQRWCTHESDDARWEAYRIEHQLPSPAFTSDHSKLELGQQLNQFLPQLMPQSLPVGSQLSTIPDQCSRAPSGNGSPLNECSQEENQENQSPTDDSGASLHRERLWADQQKFRLSLKNLIHNYNWIHNHLITTICIRHHCFLCSVHHCLCFLCTFIFWNTFFCVFNQTHRHSNIGV